jgi:hypothetical protein
MGPIEKRIREAVRDNTQVLHGRNGFITLLWLIDEQRASISALESQLAQSKQLSDADNKYIKDLEAKVGKQARVVEAAKFSLKHLESMENYSLVSGARYILSEALAQLSDGEVGK